MHAAGAVAGLLLVAAAFIPGVAQERDPCVLFEGATATLQPQPAAAPAQHRSATECASDARKLFEGGDTQGALERLQTFLRQAVGTAELHDLLGQVFLKLERKDEAAFQLETALRMYTGADPRTGPQKLLRANLLKADPLYSRRSLLLKKIAEKLTEAAKQLEESGNKERALVVLEPLVPLATEPELAAAIQALTEKIRASTKKVSLDEAAQDAADSTDANGVRPLIELESKRYKIEANLEREVVQRVADLMDDIYEYYIKVYFDGDSSRVISVKPTIRIHPSKEAMLVGWEGEQKPDGWWSPSDWTVTCYDTRSNSGSLDSMVLTLFHEASHQFMTMLAKGSNTPAWLNEGTSTFFEGAVAMADRRVLWPDAAIGRLSALQWQMAGGGGGPSVAQVISYNDPGSYGGEYYSYGWGLVYFLQQYEDPTTFEYVYRPLYARYRDEITSKTRDSMELFKQIFLGPDSPGGITTLDAWIERWRKWILTDIYPLHAGNELPKRRELRMALVKRYLAAAEKARNDKAAKVPSTELFSRALGHLEYVRTKIDPADNPDFELLLTQAKVLEELGRKQSAAALYEQALEAADRLSEEHPDDLALVDVNLAEITKHLAKLDKGNAALALAKNRARAYARESKKLLTEYAAAAVPMRLSSYMFAQLTAGATADPELAKESERLRKAARDAGLLSGAVVALGGRETAWTSIFSNEEQAFETTEDKTTIEGVRPVGRICTATPINGEYEMRFTLKREGEIKRTSYAGVVVSGTPTSDWITAGIDGKGQLIVRRYAIASGGASEHGIAIVALDPLVALEEVPSMKVHAFPEGRLEVTVGTRPAVSVDLGTPLRRNAFAGVFAKYGRTVLDSPVIEIYP